ncbi:hypothetical protein, partial [Mesorhizobium shonense]|uniref:hypothetical protein n=1 Tax=Mesorhizobium shonense TaxID=1209948 RepID=UPI00339A528B
PFIPSAHCKSLQLANRSESQNITKRDFCSSLLKPLSTSRLIEAGTRMLAIVCLSDRPNGNGGRP